MKKQKEPVTQTKSEPGKITGQLLHELANQKKAELGQSFLSWDEISAESQEMYHYVAAALEKQVTLRLAVNEAEEHIQ